MQVGGRLVAAGIGIPALDCYDVNFLETLDSRICASTITHPPYAHGGQNNQPFSLLMAGSASLATKAVQTPAEPPTLCHGSGDEQFYRRVSKDPHPCRRRRYRDRGFDGHGAESLWL